MNTKNTIYTVIDTQPIKERGCEQSFIYVRKISDTELNKINKLIGARQSLKSGLNAVIANTDNNLINQEIEDKRRTFKECVNYQSETIIPEKLSKSKSFKKDCEKYFKLNKEISTAWEYSRQEAFDYFNIGEELIRKKIDSFGNFKGIYSHISAAIDFPIIGMNYFEIPNTWSKTYNKNKKKLDENSAHYLGLTWWLDNKFSSEDNFKSGLIDTRKNLEYISKLTYPKGTPIITFKEVIDQIKKI